jgi:GTP cyclohydrolase II
LAEFIDGTQWPQITERPPVVVPTQAGDVQVQLAPIGNASILIVTSVRSVDVPVVRFQSACMFGEGLRAVDCDCGAQLEAAVGLICSRGGVLTYAWEEGRGLGIAAKLDAIALEQSLGIDTAEAFSRLGRPAEPRTFDNHVAALRMVFGGDAVVLASRNPAKVEALRRAGISVVDRIDLQVPVTPERERYLESKIAALGHFV